MSDGIGIYRCSVCGWPVVHGQCIHTISGLSADEWKKLSSAEREERARQIIESNKQTG